MRRIATLSTVLLLAGCTVGPDYRPPTTPVGERWIAPVGAEPVDPAWWTRFHDPLLSELVAAAVAANQDLAEADARLREARANRDAVRGTAAPQAEASASVARNRLSENGQLPVGRVPGLGRDLSLFDVGFDASWELDLWGRTRRAIDAAEARAQASSEIRRGVVVRVVAEVVRSYVDLRAAQGLEASAEADATSREAIARLVADRLRVGVAPQADALRAEAQAHAAAATIPGYESDAAAAAFRIALLVGQPPEALSDRLLRPGPLPRADVAVSAGLRSDLLQRRPDIREAERELAAATADIGVAKADLFPRISLLSAVGLQARGVGDLASGDSLHLGLGSVFHWPILSFGRIKARIRASQARADAAAARYRRAVLSALSDSETAINRYASAVRAKAERDRARTAAAAAVELARRRYRAGEDDLTALLQAQLASTESDRLGLQAEAAELQQLTAVYKALGGGWEVGEGAAIGQPKPRADGRPGEGQP